MAPGDRVAGEQGGVAAAGVLAVVSDAVGGLNLGHAGQSASTQMPDLPGEHAEASLERPRNRPRTSGPHGTAPEDMSIEAGPATERAEPADHRALTRAA